MKNAASWQSFVLIWGSVVLIVASLFFAREVLIPFVLAILFTFVLAPLVTQLQRTGLGRVPAVLVVVSLACLLFVGMGALLVSQVEGLALDIPEYEHVVKTKIESLKEAGQGSWGPVAHSLSEIWKAVNLTEPKGPPETPVPVQIQQNDHWSIVGAVIGPILDFLVNTGLVLILVIFMLISREDLRNRLIRLSGTHSLTLTTKALDDASGRISRFLLMQLIINGSFGMAVAVGLLLIGVPYAILWGFSAAVLRYIPYIGPMMSAVLPLFMTLIVFTGWTQFLLVGALFIVLELWSNNVMETWLYGKSIGVSNVAVLISAVFWSWIWGPVGLVLATPLTAVLVVLGRHIPRLAFLDVLLGDRQVLKPHYAFFQRLLAHDEDEASDLVEEYRETHSEQEVYDDLLLPALQLAKSGRDRDEISGDDLALIIRVVGDLVNEAPNVGDADSEPLDTATERLLVAGCPVRDETEELALRMFQNVVESAACRFQVLSHQTLLSELRTFIRTEKPQAVCFFAMPPGGFTQARLNCKRLHAEFPKLKIFVVCWRVDEATERTRAKLLRAGATEVVSTLAELSDRLTPLFPAMSYQKKQTTRQVAAV